MSIVPTGARPLFLRIGQLAQATGLTRDTLRFYERRGLLAARRGANGWREYPAQAVEWLRYLRVARGLGFTLAEIEAHLPLLDAGAAEGSTAQLRAALEHKLAEIDARVAGLSALRAELARRLDEANADCPLRG